MKYLGFLDFLVTNIDSVSPYAGQGKKIVCFRLTGCQKKKSCPGGRKKNFFLYFFRNIVVLVYYFFYLDSIHYVYLK